MISIENKFNKGDLIYYLAHNREENINPAMYDDYFSLDGAKEHHSYHVESIVVYQIGRSVVFNYKINNWCLSRMYGIRNLEIPEIMIFTDWEKCYKNFLNEYLGNSTKIRKFLKNKSG